MTAQLKFLRHQLRKNAQASLGCRQSESDTCGNKWERCDKPSDALCHMPLRYVNRNWHGVASKEKGG